MGSGSGEVGSLYTLTCTVTLSHRASDSSVSIQWQGPGLSHTDDDDDDDDDSTDNRVVVSELSLNPLTLGHGGDYTCTAEYTVDGETVTNSGNITLNVLSKLLLVCYHFMLTLYLHLFLLIISGIVCSSRGIFNIEIECDGIESGTTTQCSFNRGPWHHCNSHLHNITMFIMLKDPFPIQALHRWY